MYLFHPFLQPMGQRILVHPELIRKIADIQPWAPGGKSVQCGRTFNIDAGYLERFMANAGRIAARILKDSRSWTALSPQQRARMALEKICDELERITPP